MSLFKSFSLGSTVLLAVAMLSPAHALDSNQEQINACVKGATTYKGADRATANKLCTCTINVRSNMTIGQMWEIESYAQSGKDPSTLPYAKRMQSELQQCADGLTLNPPQKPQ